MASITESEFRSRLKQGALSGTYVLYGAEKYTLLRAAHKIIEQSQKIPYADFNSIKLGSDCSLSSLEDAMTGMPFFADKRYIIANDWSVDSLSPSDIKSLSALLGELDDSTLFLIYLPDTEKLSAKWKKLDDVAHFVDFKRVTGAELEKYLVAYAKKLGCTLSRELAGRIIRYNKGPLEQLVGEVDKVCAYSGGGEIKREHVEAVVSKNSEEKAFALSKALLGGKYEEAYNVIDSLTEQREEPIAIVALLSSAYINLYRVKCMLESGVEPSVLAEHFNYKGKGFLIENAMRDCRRFEMSQLQKSIELLTEADYRLKGGSGSSQASVKRVVLDELIAKLLLTMQEDR